MANLVTVGLLLMLITGAVWSIKLLDQQQADRIRSLNYEGSAAAARGLPPDGGDRGGGVAGALVGSTPPRTRRDNRVGGRGRLRPNSRMARRARGRRK